MNQKTILIGAATFIVGILTSGAIAAYAVNGNHTGVMGMYAMHNGVDIKDTTIERSTANNLSMDEMTTSLKSKTGDTFDKAFISEMIVHHQGAIDMANLALTNANHQEVKDLAKNIITAQTSEISQMKQWQSQWGYTSNTMMDDHSMMGL